jgi:ABC-type lipoprotein release transport system permease subunit
VSLSTGLACVLLIYLWINDELQVDKFNEKDDRLYQVMVNVPVGDNIETGDGTPGPLASALLDEVAEVENAASVVASNFFYTGVLSSGNSHVRSRPQFVDKNYFDVFTCNFIQGKKDFALVDKNSIVISDEIALKLFKSTDHFLGKSLEFKNEYFRGSYTVSGVFEKPPRNATAQYDVLFSYDLFLDRRPEAREWSNGGIQTYVLLDEDTDVDQFNNKIGGFMGDKLSGARETLFVQKYSDRYLYGKYENGKPVAGRIVYVRLFAVIALFIILIACVNFMNLSTAKASRRVKEIGIRKAMGAQRRILIFQYMSESLVMAFVALIFAIALVTILLPLFNSITGKQLILEFSFPVMSAIIAITILTGMIAGSYPALYLSGFKPTLIFKGLITSSPGELWLRRGLVIFQFSISVILIVSVLVIYEQINFIQTKDLGYDKENILYFPMEGSLAGNHETFLAEVRSLPGVVNASYMCGDLTGGVSTRSGGLLWEGTSSTEAGIAFNYLEVDYGMIELLGVEIKEGRSFSREFKSDTAAIIFNEAAIDAMGLKDPVGKTVDFYGRRQIIGVVKDFHFHTLYQEVEPLFFMIDKWSEGNIQVKLQRGHEASAITKIQKLHKAFNPGFPFEYKFLDEDYQAQYSSERRVGILSRYFAGLAVLISCLGLFGLAAFTVERKIKEIGIRKILGSTEFGIIYLLSSDFTKMIFTSLLIALPISYLILKNWLEDFAFRVDLETWYFGATSILILFISWLTVGIQTVKAARTNPVQHLRAE